MSTQDKEAKLKRTYLDWQQWVADGRKRYGTGEKSQLKYDNYRDGLLPISENPAETIFFFSIQVFDSPEGDRWWQGRCEFQKTMGYTRVIILEDNCVTH